MSDVGQQRDVGVVIVAGGSSTRTGAGESNELKQFRWVAGKPVLLHSLQTFMARPDVVSVVVVLPRDYVPDPPPWIFQCDVDRLMLAPGGRTRTESVRNGLEDLPDEASIVLVHDAARPLVDDATIARVITGVRESMRESMRESAGERAGSARSVIAALPVVDTLKAVDADGHITHTVPRESLWRAQTPQGFSRAVIERAHRDAKASGVDATDDAALCERIGVPVTVVRGSERAMKITEEADFARVEVLYGLTQ